MNRGAAAADGDGHLLVWRQPRLRWAVATVLVAAVLNPFALGATAYEFFVNAPRGRAASAGLLYANMVALGVIIGAANMLILGRARPSWLRTMLIGLPVALIISVVGPVGVLMLGGAGYGILSASFDPAQLLAQLPSFALFALPLAVPGFLCALPIFRLMAVRRG